VAVEQDTAGQDAAGQDAVGRDAGPDAAGRDAEPDAAGRDAARRITEAFIAVSRDNLVGRMGIEIVTATAERVIGTMPVAGNTQPYGLLHGGASCVLAETLGSLGAALHGGPDRLTVGIEISATHHRAASAGVVTGVATRLHGGRTTASYEVVLRDEQGRRLCTSRLTCLITDRLPGASGAGA
jgi:1,4-dihydroxy-2-naphthoyl-CoA hydrolase